MRIGKNDCVGRFVCAGIGDDTVSMDTSRYLSDITALLVTWSILSVFSGVGMLMERNKDKQ